jgi:hypothetical protein
VRLNVNENSANGFFRFDPVPFAKMAEQLTRLEGE